MRILMITSQFPIAGEPTRGRPISQTAQALASLATLRVLSPVARYPRWSQPRSYVYRAPGPPDGGTVCDTRYVAYPALPMLSRPFNGWLCARALHDEARAFAPDVILSYWLYPDAFGAQRVAHRLGVPLVAGARGSDIRVRDAVSRLLTRPVVRGAQRLLVVSRDLGTLAASQYGADPSRIRVIPNGCDATIFRRGDRVVARRELGVPADAELVLYVGRLVPEKGLRELVAAAQALRARRPALRLVLLGQGPMHAELAQAAAASGSLPIDLPGAMPPVDVARWMTAADIVTLPSYSEGHPNVIVEALACGRPVVATPVGGIPEVVDGDSAILVPARDSNALAVGLAQALDRQWDEAALSRRFSRGWDEVAADTLQACAEAIAAHAGHASRRRQPT